MSQLLQVFVRGGVGGASGPSAVYVFDGVDDYATIPPWTPNGIPFSVEASVVPLSAPPAGPEYIVTALGASRWGLWNQFGTGTLQYQYQDTAFLGKGVGATAASIGVAYTLKG
ncbi:MAG: hypothetical protein KAI25_03850, partial [Hyphomicrobiaceae bacterium]|nr:hypothetical protein [Hyphomicrobiaceae bacterium]